MPHTRTTSSVEVDLALEVRAEGRDGDAQRLAAGCS
jgi:hypothetical protein